MAPSTVLVLGMGIVLVVGNQHADKGFSWGRGLVDCGRASEEGRGVESNIMSTFNTLRVISSPCMLRRQSFSF
jgi:hypothetical protein